MLYEPLGLFALILNFLLSISPSCLNLINIALPRVRDFRGLSKRSFDGKGNYSLGLKEQIVFPEIDYDNIDTIRGMDICVVTTAKSDEEGKELLKNFDFPFIN